MDSEIDIDNYIEKLRSIHIAEENNRKQHKPTQKNSKKIYGVKNRAYYDINGKIISIKKLSVLPALLPKCKKTIYEPNDYKKTNIQPLREHRNVKKYNDNAGQSLENNSKKNCEIYNALIPAVGVTFIESGKEAKVYKDIDIRRIKKSNFKSIRPLSVSNRPVLNNVYDYTNIEQPQNPCNSTVKELIGHNIKVTISDNISQLFTSNEQQFHQQKNSKSVIPCAYVPPMYRKENILINMKKRNTSADESHRAFGSKTNYNFFKGEFLNK